MVKPYGNTVSSPPPANKVVKYSDGMFGPVMFHYANEGTDLKSLARENGFDVAFVLMQDEAAPNHYLAKRYAEGDFERMMIAWRPTAPGPGWELVGQSDSDDGPVATFVRPIAPTAGDDAAAESVAPSCDDRDAEIKRLRGYLRGAWTIIDKSGLHGFVDRTSISIDQTRALHMAALPAEGRTREVIEAEIERAEDALQQDAELADPILGDRGIGSWMVTLERLRDELAALPPEGEAAPPATGVKRGLNTCTSPASARAHLWIPSSLGHGETMCQHCFITNREAGALGMLDHCEKAS